MKFLVLVVLAAAATVCRAQIAAQPYVVPVYRHIAAQSPPVTRYQHVCSGTMLENSAVLTTVTCANLAVLGGDSKPLISTALDESSAIIGVKGFYQVTEIFKHPDYNAATNANNIAIFKFGGQFDTSVWNGKVKTITWLTDSPAAGTKCLANYWDTETPFLQVNKEVLVTACTTPKDGTICSDYVPIDPAVCPGGTDGGSLVCNGKLAGQFAPQAATDCATTWQYEDLAQDDKWLWKNVNAAPVTHVSVAAILVTLAAILNNF